MGCFSGLWVFKLSVTCLVLSTGSGGDILFGDFFGDLFPYVFVLPLCNLLEEGYFGFYFNCHLGRLGNGSVVL